MTTTYRTGTSISAAAGRIVLTLVGSAALIVAAFLDWLDGIRGTELDIRALWTTTFRSTTTFVQTVGFAMIVIALIAIVGMAIGSGWLTRIAGAVGIVGFALLAIEVYRSAADESIQVGAWLALAGSVVVLVAGFFTGQRDLVSSPPTVVVDERA